MKVDWGFVFSRFNVFMKIYWPYIIVPLFLILLLYWLLPPAKREWVKDSLIPILFFLFMTSRILWRAITIVMRWTGKPHILILISVNNLLILLFMALTITSYIIRSKPTHRATGFMERFFPLFVVFFHLFGSYLIAMFTKFRLNLTLYIAGIAISVLGVSLDCMAMWKLKRSFSIMAEVRPLITKGIYGRIRHPLYAGELIHFFGISLLFNNKTAYGLFVLLLIMQTVRALIEEKKMIAHFPEYGEYRKRTGFFLPRFRRKMIVRPQTP
ncbi:MAG: methyltransferase family protein [bacterium]